jgi:metal-responsive CopG/Arc/MetJ family transcriptional regulator
MKRTTISLPDDIAAALEREARRRRVPVSQVAREAIEARLGGTADGVRKVSFIGIVHSVEPSMASEDIEGFLAEHWAHDIARDR